MFEGLSERLQGVIKKVKGYGKITEENISDMMREIRLALLEADVNYKVTKEFTNKVKEKALGEEVKGSINPGDLFVKIVKDELTELLGGTEEPLEIKNKFSIMMMVGLQGSGKTTSTGKLANLLRKKYNKKVLMVACDVYRPAAIDQLKQIGKSLNMEVYSEDTKDVVLIAKNAVQYAKENNFDYVLIDTAGRLHIDDNLMEELKELQKEITEYKKEVYRIQGLIAQASGEEFLPIQYTGGNMIWPVAKEGTAITSYYEQREHPISGIVHYHSGIDIGNAYFGTPVVAAMDGYVSYAGWLGGYGNCVIINHGDGVSTLYGHGQAILTTLHKQVKQGDLIMEVGSTGNSTGPHLHFEVRINGYTVNPLLYVNEPT